MNLRHKLLLWRLKWMNISGNDKKLKHIRLSGHKVGFKNGPEMIHAYREIFRDNIYDFPAETTSPVILDCGAHTGVSVVFFKQLYPQSRVIAFEPDPESFRLLQHNTSAFKDITLEQKAVWIHNEGVRFENRGDMSSSIINTPQQVNGVLTPSARLRDYLSQPVDMLKLDIEGAEIDVLYDCKSLLHNVKNMFVEFHGKADDPEKLERLLTLFRECKLTYYIKQANDWSPTPLHKMAIGNGWDIQLNIFCKQEEKKLK